MQTFQGLTYKWENNVRYRVVDANVLKPYESSFQEIICRKQEERSTPAWPKNRRGT